METWPSPKRSTAYSQVSKYRSMPVRYFGGATHRSTSGSKDSTWIPTESMPRSATWSITLRSSGGSN